MGSESNDGPYRDALAYSLYSHGLDIVDDAETALSLMEKAGADSMDVSLFTDPAEFMVFGDQIYDVYKKVVAVDTLTPEDEKLIETAKFLGLMVNGDLNERNFAVRVQKFITVQSQLIKRHVK
jgi:pyridoxine 5'-phosphate synthase PdxJ